MAKKNRNISKNKQSELLRKQGYTYKQINRMDSATRNKLTELIISDNQTRKKEKTAAKTGQNQRKTAANSPYLQFKNRVTKKRFALEKAGFPEAMQRGKISDKKIDSIKLSDIENGHISRENYPWLFYNAGFDFDRVYKLKNGNRLFVAFRDYQGELDISDALEQFSKRSNAELLDFLEGIAHLPPSYKKGVSGSSSGKAGGYRFMVAPQEVIDVFNRDTYNETKKDKRAKRTQESGKVKRKSKRQQYKGDKVGFQVLKDGNRVSFGEVTPRNLLIVANAIM